MNNPLFAGALLAISLDLFVSLVVALLLRGVHQRFPQPYLSAWLWAFGALAASAFGRVLVVLTQPGAWRNLATMTSLSGGMFAFLLLVSGALLLRGAAPLKREQHHAIAVAVLAIAAALTLGSGLLPPGNTWRLILRGSLPEAAVSIAAGYGALVTWRSRQAVRSFSILSIAFGALAVTRATSAISVVLGPSSVRGLFLTGASSASLVLLAVSLFTVLLDVESARAEASAASERETEQRLTVAFRRSEAFYRSLIDASRDVMTLVGYDGTIVFCSSAVTRALGYEPAALVGTRIFDIVHPDDVASVQAAFARAITEHGGPPQNAQYRARTADGDWVMMESVGSPLAVPDAPPRILLASRDLRERVPKVGASAAADGEGASDATVRAAQSRRLITEQSSAFAHDFNNLLAVIRTSLELLGDPTLPADERVDVLNDATTAALRAGDLSRSMLAALRTPDSRPMDLDLRQVVQHNERLLRRLAGDRVQMTVQLPNAPMRVRAESALVVQILLNLVVNARDAMPTGGTLTLAVRAVSPAERAPVDLAATPAPPGEVVELSVTDTGTGMSAEILTRAFEPYFTSKTEGKGTGLGLALCRTAAQRLGAGLKVASAPGRGTVFRLLIAKLPDVAA